MTKKPSVWVNCFVKNEERWIWYALNSVLPFVDRVLVWDTGSTDKTVAVIRSINNSKISFKQAGRVNKKNYSLVRQKMIEATKGDWIFILAGDEVWPKAPLKKLMKEVKNAKPEIRSFCVRVINFVGDLRYIHPETFLGQAPYAPAGIKGLFSDRVFRRKIPGLHMAGEYGQEGFYDGDKITLREKKEHVKYLTDVYYWHLSYLPRSTKDNEVMMRRRKRKYEIGLVRPDWIEVPEVFSASRPKIVPDPFYKMTSLEYFNALIQTPLKKIKRRISGWKKN